MVGRHIQITELEPRFYANKIGRLMLLSLEDVMGRNGVNALLNLAGRQHLINHYPPNDLKREFPFRDMAALIEAMTTMYGTRGARSMQLRAGHYAFNLGIKEFGPLLGIAGLPLKLMPTTMKMKIALNGAAQTFDRFTDQPTRVEEQGGHFIYIIEKCPVCWGRRLDKPSCYLAQGVLEETVRWAAGGRTFNVEEIECRGSGGSACLFAIEKAPAD